MKISGEMYTLPLIYSYVAVCRFCVICCVIIICFPLLFSNYLTCAFNIIFMFVFLFCIFVFYFVYSVFLYFLCISSHFLYIAVPFLFLYKFAYYCHGVET